MDMDEAIRFHPFNPTHTLQFRNRTKRSRMRTWRTDLAWPGLFWPDLIWLYLDPGLDSLLCTPFSLSSWRSFYQRVRSKTVLPWPLTALILPSKHSQSDQSLFKDPCWEQWVRAGVGGLWLWLWLSSMIISRYILRIPWREFMPVGLLHSTVQNEGYW
jgi:hypothetical protein